MINDDTPETTETDKDRLRLLDRMAERLPEINLDEHEVSWHQMPDGAPALLLDGGGFDGGDGVTFANAGDDVHAIGPTALLVPGAIGCVVIHSDKTRELGGLVRDPLTGPPETD